MGWDGMEGFRTRLHAARQCKSKAGQGMQVPVDMGHGKETLTMQLRCTNGTRGVLVSQRRREQRAQTWAPRDQRKNSAVCSNRKNDGKIRTKKKKKGEKEREE